jgi:flagellar hook protein FlgE
MNFTKGMNALNAASKNLEVIGNNIANASTVGFKAGQLYFSEVLANSQSSAGVAVGGSGGGAHNVLPQFSQGNMESTNNPLDLALNGNGMFQLRDKGSLIYSRAGQFQLDQDGFVTNSAGARVQGFAANVDGTIATSTVVDLNFSSDPLPATATAAAAIEVNLDGRKAIKDPSGFSISDSSSYQNTTSIPVFDAAGNQHSMALYFVKTATSQWDVFASADGKQAGSQAIGTLAFQANGEIDSAATRLPFTVPLTLSSGQTMNVSLDMSGTTAVNSDFVVSSSTVDGCAAGQLTSYNVDASGLIRGRYSNGLTRNLAQVAVATFNNPQALRPLGSNGFAATAEAGIPVVSTPNTGMTGTIQSGSLEQSNVDLTAELVRLIEAQRIYQANAQALKAVDSVMQSTDAIVR